MSSPSLDRQLLLCHVLQKSKTYLMTWPDIELTEEQTLQYNQLLEQRSSGVPLAYLTGVKSFWDMELKVTPDVLIPRPETELLVETALQSLPENANVLELGTGSGAIACALFRERPDLNITATDISHAALNIAQHNADHFQCKINFIQSDWFSSVPLQQFDLILSNPPYLSETDPHLQTDIRFEPRNALVSGENGDEDYRAILSQASNFLKPEGWILFEHGFEQGEHLRSLLTKAGFTQVKTLQDLAGLDRVTIAQQKAAKVSLRGFE